VVPVGGLLVGCSSNDENGFARECAVSGAGLDLRLGETVLEQGGVDARYPARAGLSSQGSREAASLGRRLALTGVGRRLRGRATGFVRLVCGRAGRRVTRRWRLRLSGLIGHHAVVGDVGGPLTAVPVAELIAARRVLVPAGLRLHRAPI